MIFFVAMLFFYKMPDPAAIQSNLLLSLPPPFTFYNSIHFTILDKTLTLSVSGTCKFL
jgi:hypothetical protein